LVQIWVDAPATGVPQVPDSSSSDLKFI